MQPMDSSRRWLLNQATDSSARSKYLSAASQVSAMFNPLLSDAETAAHLAELQTQGDRQADRTNSVDGLAH